MKKSLAGIIVGVSALSSLLVPSAANSAEKPWYHNTWYCRVADEDLMLNARYANEAAGTEETIRAEFKKNPLIEFFDVTGRADDYVGLLGRNFGITWDLYQPKGKFSYGSVRIGNQTLKSVCSLNPLKPPRTVMKYMGDSPLFKLLKK